MAGRNDHMLAGKLVLFLMFGFIVSLVFALSAEYQSNQFQQKWVSDNASWLQYLLNGYLAAALVGIFIGGAFLLVAEIVRSRNRRGGLKTVVYREAKAIRSISSLLRTDALFGSLAAARISSSARHSSTVRGLLWDA